jgi:hypothetical protein
LVPGLTGADYHGHAFWDIEIYLLPFYIMTWPQAARALLMYRFHTVEGARAKAKGMGWRGALYTWESADTGEETAPERAIGTDRKVIRILSGRQEQHISADVAYAVWQYWQATRDEGFLLAAGAEILLETARFWASRARPEADDRCHIRGVIGPDEYHLNVDDNAFTQSDGTLEDLSGTRRRGLAVHEPTCTMSGTLARSRTRRFRTRMLARRRRKNSDRTRCEAGTFHERKRPCKFSLLRATLRPRKLVELRDACARSGTARRLRDGAALFHEHRGTRPR